MIPCFPHVINIATTKVTKAIGAAYRNIATSQSPPHLVDATDDDPDHSLQSRDPIALSRALVTAVRASGKRRAELADVIRVGNEKGRWTLKQLQLIRDVPTRWDSVYSMIDRLIYLSAVCLQSFLGCHAYSFGSLLIALSPTMTMGLRGMALPPASGPFCRIFGLPFKLVYSLQVPAIVFDASSNIL